MRFRASSCVCENNEEFNFARELGDQNCFWRLLLKCRFWLLVSCEIALNGQLQDI